MSDPSEQPAGVSSLEGRADPGSPEFETTADSMSAMAPRFNFAFRWFAKRFFAHLGLDGATVDDLRQLEKRGSVVYVMRYASRLDYFLFNALFNRHGLRLSRFANGIHFYYYWPVLAAIRASFSRRRGLSQRERHRNRRGRVQQLVRSGDSLFLFLRTERLRNMVSGGRGATSTQELDLIEVAVRESAESGRPVFFVPLALFWRKGPRSSSRFLNLSYGASTRPSDLAKVTSFLATYRDLSVKTGAAIDLLSFRRERSSDSLTQIARKVRRSIMIHLSSEEKVVEGPALRPTMRVLQEVLADRGVRQAIEVRATERGGSFDRAELEAERLFREVAANMNSTFLAVIGAIVGWVFRRIFSSIETSGLEIVAARAREHPLVLVPNHRSYFDFLILSWLFYQNFLVPPHIVARDNMAFGPFGFLFRRAGAFFMRKRLDDPLYKEVFRAYVSYLVREGYTQEFFIEGARSRTGKSLAPRFGILSWDVEAFLQSHRRDLLFVPIGITYERLVEESSMVDELQGGEKKEESVLGLVRARRFLRSRFGSVHIHFDEPLSLAAAMGDGIRTFQGPSNEAVEEEKRRFVETFGYRIIERINWSAVANSTSVAASVLLGSPHRGMRREQFVQHMQWTLDLLHAQDVRCTSALESDEGEFAESLAFLVSASLVRVEDDPRGEIVYFEESRRRALDIYRNATSHYLASASFVARMLLPGSSRSELEAELPRWQWIFEREFFAARSHERRGDAARLLAHFNREGWLDEDAGGRLQVKPSAEVFFLSLAEQTRGLLELYTLVCEAVLEVRGAVVARELPKAVEGRFERARILGEAVRGEALNPTTVENALAWLVREGVLVREPVRDDQRSGETVYGPGEEWAALESLRARLAAGLVER
jgi:glycerol-3-phosphate O-acyltransferase